MWLSLNIISKFVDISDIDPEELALKLTMATAEIEAVEYLNKHFETIVTAKILDVKKHPDADKLTLVDVDTGKKKYTVVCGAPNHKTGDIVPLATEGTKFSEEFIVKKTKIRGVESRGMLCSDKELGFSDDHSGIKIFPEDTKIGTPLSKIYSDWLDVRLEIDNKSITHRPDLWSHAGFAREISALYGKKMKDTVNHSIEKELKDTGELKVKIQCPEECPRYSGLIVNNIKIEESPEWLKSLVSSIGMRPINNIVDITNYVMAEIGEPMHAFDKKKLKGKEIIVRLAKNGEELVTLDGQEFKLNKEDIVIADKSGAIALAGVMGGGNSEVQEDTTEIVLEAANFNPINIRKTAQRYSHRTEAAIRFEKSLSPELTKLAILRCYELIKEVIPGSKAGSAIIDDFPKKPKKINIKISTDLIRQRLGEDIPDKRIIEILTSLNFELEVKEKLLKIQVPAYRATKDVSIPEDIVEEIGRIYGYDNITQKPAFVPCATPEINKFRTFERQVKDILTMHFNMIEVSGYSFCGEKELNKLKINEDKELRLQNQLSIEQDRLRRSIVPNIIMNLEFNQRYEDDFQIYEMGRVYLKDDRKSKELITENHRVTGAVFAKKTDIPLFYYSKNIVNNLMKKLMVKKFQLIPENKNLPPYAHPAKSMKLIIDKKDAGLIFELHPATVENFELNGSASIFDLDLEAIFNSKKHEIKFNELQKFPEVPFEISVLTDKFTYSEDIIKVIANSNQKYIKNVNVVSIYEGSPIPEGQKSVSTKVTFAAKDKTLSPEEIENLQNKVIADLNKKGYSLR